MSYRKNGLLSDMLASSKRFRKVVTVAPSQVTLSGDTSIVNNSSGSIQVTFAGGSAAPSSYQWYYNGDANPTGSGTYYITINDSTTYGASQTGNHTYYGTQGANVYSSGGDIVCQLNIYSSFSGAGGWGYTWRNTYGGALNGKPLTGWYRCVASNSAGTVTSGWIKVVVAYNPYNCNGVGRNCSACSYDCNCDCYNETNCCCYDSNNDGISCCDVNPGCTDPGAQQCCCSAEWCGTSYNCYNCSTCWDYCTDFCPNEGNQNCDHHCAYIEYSTCYDETYPN